MHFNRQYGRENCDTFALPRVEPFRYRAQKLARKRLLRLCEWCYRGHCYESLRQNRHRSWKAYRLTQYKLR